jgi:hypothetical protein
LLSWGVNRVKRRRKRDILPLTPTLSHKGRGGICVVLATIFTRCVQRI